MTTPCSLSLSLSHSLTHWLTHSLIVSVVGTEPSFLSNLIYYYLLFFPGLSGCVFRGIMKKGYRVPTPIQRKVGLHLLSQSFCSSYTFHLDHSTDNGQQGCSSHGKNRYGSINAFKHQVWCFKLRDWNFQAILLFRLQYHLQQTSLIWTSEIKTPCIQDDTYSGWKCCSYMLPSPRHQSASWTWNGPKGLWIREVLLYLYAVARWLLWLIMYIKQPKSSCARPQCNNWTTVQ